MLIYNSSEHIETKIGVECSVLWGSLANILMHYLFSDTWGVLAIHKYTSRYAGQRKS